MLLLVFLWLSILHLSILQGRSVWADFIGSLRGLLAQCSAGASALLPSLMQPLVLLLRSLDLQVQRQFHLIVCRTQSWGK